MRQTTASLILRFFIQLNKRDEVRVQIALAIRLRTRTNSLSKSELRQDHSLPAGQNKEEMNVNKANDLHTVERRVQPLKSVCEWQQK
jgi:hypothetical protein